MIMILKALLLFFAVIVVMPVIFLFLVSFFGKSFSIYADKNSYLKKLRKG